MESERTGRKRKVLLRQRLRLIINALSLNMSYIYGSHFSFLDDTLTIAKDTTVSSEKTSTNVIHVGVKNAFQPEQA